MAKGTSLKYKTPVGDLAYVNIRGEGKKKMSGDTYQYTASVIMSQAMAEEQEKILNNFWKDNRPKGALAKQSKPLIKPYMVKTDKVDADGDPIKEHQKNEKGELLYYITAKTNVTWPDGKPNLPGVLNAKGLKVNLGEKKIGNGSRGVIHGSIGVYDVDGSQGLSFYLKAIQLTKFVEYTGDQVDAEELGDETEGLDGLEELEEVTTAQIQI